MKGHSSDCLTLPFSQVRYPEGTPVPLAQGYGEGSRTCRGGPAARRDRGKGLLRPACEIVRVVQIALDRDKSGIGFEAKHHRGCGDERIEESAKGCK